MIDVEPDWDLFAEGVELALAKIWEASDGKPIDYHFPSSVIEEGVF